MRTNPPKAPSPPALSHTHTTHPPLGLIIFADYRYNVKSKRLKLPKWIQSFLHDEYMNLSADVALGFVKSFLRLMSQPIDPVLLQSVFFGEDDIAELDRLETEGEEAVQQANAAGAGAA